MEVSGGNRLTWTEVPTAVRSAIESAVGTQVVAAVSQPGGFSPGLAARLTLADGRRVFAKAVGLERNPDSPAMHRHEAVIAAQLPAHAPAPRLLWSYDDSDWVALVFEDIDGRTPTLPWRPDEWLRVHDAMVSLAETLTPNPVGEVRRLADRGFSGWRSLEMSSHGATDPWARRNHMRLIELEDAWPSAVDGDTLVHMDARADNILLTARGAVFVDWPHAAVGAPWADLLFMLPSVVSQGGPEPADVWAATPLAAKADPDAVNAALAGIAGYFTYSATLPPPKNLETVRAFQRVQGDHALRWLESRLKGTTQ
ncbi:hypothetical protein GCM10029964_033800 [Kibdelosporangium lantanae]